MKYKHDCDKCKFHGSFNYNDSIVDVYTCNSAISNIRSLILRYGDDGPDYMSACLFIGDNHLTLFDKIAIFGGLELTPAEKDKLLKVLLNNVRQSMTLEDYREIGNFRFSDNNNFY